MEAAVRDVLSRSGGSTQRLQHPRPHVANSVLSERLQEAWGWGLLSAPLLQWLADGAVQDGSQGVQDLANIGSKGMHEGNCHRDLVRLLKPRCQLPSPTLVRVPLLQVKDNAVIQGDWPVLLPSHLLQYFAGHMPHKMEALLEGARKFWSTLPENDPKLRGHPCHGWEAGWQSKTLPLALHGDAGTYTKAGESVIVVSWGSLLHRSETWDSIYLIFAIPKGALVKEPDQNTLNILFEAVAADFKAMLTGGISE